jgi:hypothetical protein
MVWGIITMCLGFVRNFAGFVAVRAILGVAEGGLLPGMVCGACPRSFSLIPAGSVSMSETKTPSGTLPVFLL